LVHPDFRGHETTFEYDGANRLVLRTEPLGKTTEYGYDEVGNVTRETDALKRVTTHEYSLAAAHRSRRMTTTPRIA
jgi:YD repeat-containing protein